ncbi:MAG: hypothetical protein GYA46_14095 [candidate division Zixibacteria bacterium]|nr:hypothetical protein [candidate division Zixibacteria bacterium]
MLNGEHYNHDYIGGTECWSEVHSNLNVIGGLFSLQLGTTAPIPDSIFLDTTLYIGVSVGGDTEMAPRLSLAAGPYSYRIQAIDGADGGTVNGNVAITGKINIGTGNSNSGAYAFVAGESDTADGTHATVSGGRNNSAKGYYSAIGGGLCNKVEQGTYFATISGGDSNFVSHDKAFIGGGVRNVVTALGAAIVSGEANIASGSGAFIGGGYNNLASGLMSSIPGGHSNEASAHYSFAAGYSAKARHMASFVLSAGMGDSTCSGGSG